MLNEIRDSFRRGTFTFGLHGFSRMVQSGLRESDLLEAIGFDDPEIIEDYPSDIRGPSCLIQGVCRRGIIHVVCTSSTRPFVITVYRPDPDQWDEEFRNRKR